MKLRNTLFALVAVMALSLSVVSCETADPLEDMVEDLDLQATDDDDGDGDPVGNSPGNGVGG